MVYMEDKEEIKGYEQFIMKPEYKLAQERLAEVSHARIFRNHPVFRNLLNNILEEYGSIDNYVQNIKKDE